MSMRVYRASITLAVLSMFVLSSAPVAAQNDIPNFDDALTITSSPTHPRPGETVTLTLTSSLHDLDITSITWRAGGTVVDSGEGVRSVRVTLGALGVSTVVRADIAGGGGVEITLVPASVDILWESDAYTPPLYAGKALPSAGSRIRLLAIPYLPRSGGSYYDAKDLIYTWKLDGGTLKNLSGRGKSSASINAPSLFARYTVSVEVTTSDGRRSGRGEVRIDSTDPFLRLYRVHPLRGFEYWNALPANTFVDENEATFAAVPYFAPASSVRALTFAWQVNGRAIESDAKEPHTITLSSENPGTRGLLNLTLTQPGNILTSAEASWGMTFMRSGSVPAALDPFRTR